MFEIDRVYRRQALHDEYGGQRYGGISTPAQHPWVMLISGEEGADFGYDDEQLEDGTLLYFGEGQVGHMTFTHGNLAIRDHAENGEDLYVFRKVRQGYVRFIGQYDYAGHELREGVRDRDGNTRTAIVFQLLPHDQLVEDERSGDDRVEGVRDDDLAALRALAMEHSQSGLTPEEARTWVWRRSRAVRRYVLVRADGRCEGCEAEAPFVRPDGRPYLEPHHTRRLSDSGPDDPRWVIAVCPACHRRAHYAIDATDYNNLLQERLRDIELAADARHASSNA